MSEELDNKVCDKCAALEKPVEVIVTMDEDGITINSTSPDPITVYSILMAGAHTVAQQDEEQAQAIKH